MKHFSQWFNTPADVKGLLLQCKAYGNMSDRQQIYIILSSLVNRHMIQLSYRVSALVSDQLTLTLTRTWIKGLCATSAAQVRQHKFDDEILQMYGPMGM